MSANALPPPSGLSISSRSESTSSIPPPRQIRFVSSDGQPRTKRRRINAACLTCRKRKTRCSGERPVCNTCSDNGHDCKGYADSGERASNGQSRHSDDESGSSSPRKPGPASADHSQPASGSLNRPASQEQGATDATSVRRRSGHDEQADSRSPASNYTTTSNMSARNRVPYFRYFGPTAIVPGFKQMVVQMKDHRRSVNATSSPASGDMEMQRSTPASEVQRVPAPQIPFYDATDPSPNPILVSELCETFFIHLGCNYPFLQRERFLADLAEKKVDAILVDAVCAVAARFALHPLLSSSNDQSIPVDEEGNVHKAYRGHAFAQRAMAAVIDTFPCPTIAVAQACLLLAYEEFGTDHDSGLWMYLGTSIRMAQDLGIQKLEGLQLEGRIGPTPKTAKHGTAGKEEEKRRAAQQKAVSQASDQTDARLLEERRAVEQERIDTFYAIFFLDRAVSSGVGRPVTLRDKDIEISFPHRPDDSALHGWPHPYPPLIRIVHMYGRVADVLNNIKEVSQVTPEVLKKLAGMEKDLTGIYQGLSPKLHFNATNFQHYVKAEQGTNFILLHFWFHALIVLLHQPTLLHSFEGRIQQLFPDSRELSMSSAKTIADILAFAELIDVKSFIGNPFTSQPMYIAACAFLAEAAAHASQPQSRCTTPPDTQLHKRTKSEMADGARPQAERKQTTKHTLLATAANQNYQRCYKALKMLDIYWAGCRYILIALDQKSKGLTDPLLFTSDDVDGEMPSTELSFTTPGWRRSTSNSASAGARSTEATIKENQWSPRMDHGQAIGWSLTGTTNSPAPNLSFLYQAANGGTQGQIAPVVAHPVRRDHRPTTGPAPTTANVNPISGRLFSPSIHQHQPSTRNNTFNSENMMLPPPPPANFSPLPSDPISAAEADLLLGLNSPYASSHLTQQLSFSEPVTSLPQQPTLTGPSTSYPANLPPNATPDYMGNTSFHLPSETNFSDLLIQSQDVDMSNPQGAFNFPGGEMIPWLEYLPQDVLSYFGDATDGLGLASEGASGPSPPGDHSGP